MEKNLQAMKWNIGWGPISSCNMKCKFCYSKEVRQKKDDLNFDDWKKFIDDNHDLINSINYGTGENAMSDDWFNLVAYIAKTYGIKQALTTNGFVFERISKDPMLERILLDSISEIDVSLDFCDKEKHNTLRGQEKAYDWAINTLNYCSNYGILSTIVFIGIDDTLKEDNIQGLFEIANKYNANLRMNIFRPTIKDFESVSPFICSYDSIIHILNFINKNYEILSISDPLFSSILTTDAFEIDPSGIYSIRILSDGSITPSTYLVSEDFVMSNIKEPHVLSKMKYYCEEKIKQVIPNQCKECKFVNTCKGGVYDRRYLWYKRLEERDPYCPYREGNTMPDFKVDINKNDQFTSVHHGYLPTMFFRYKS